MIRASTNLRDSWENGRWENGTALSGHIRTDELDEEVSVGREDLVAACTQYPERTAKMHFGLPELQKELTETKDAAVLEAKIAAVWRWADTLGDGELGRTELMRLADRVGKRDLLVACGLPEPIHGTPDDFSLTEDAFAGICRANPKRTAGWFATLQLALVEERSCLDDLCTAFGM